MPPLHVALALLCGTTGGPASYGRRLVVALAELDDLRLSVLTDRPDLITASSVEVIPVPMRGGLDRLRWQHVAIPRALRRVRPDVYHDTKNALPLRLGVPAVVTVHDLAYYTVPETFGWASRCFLRTATSHAVRRARAVLVPSRATAADVARVFPQARARVHVVPHGIDPWPSVAAPQVRAVRERLGLPEHYVLHVGTLQARKNVDLVIRAVRTLREEGAPHRVVVVGRTGWLADATLAEIARDRTAHWLEHVAAADLPAVYAGADAFVSPSAYEGFGLAVGDALAAGVPAVIADVSSLPELCGDAAVRLSALTADAVADALRGLLRDDALRARLAARGRVRAAEFTWRACAEGHLAAYRAARG